MSNNLAFNNQNRIIGVVHQEQNAQPSDSSMNFVSDAISKMTYEPDGIQILVEMSRKNQIDPWNIDIVDVADKYLQHLVEMKSHNLRLTGRVLLFAAILLRLKSDILEGIDSFGQEEEELSGFDEDYDDPFYEEPINRNNVVSIDEVIQRRTSVRLNKRRIVTLKDLIKQLEFYEELEKKRSLKNAHQRAKRRAVSFANFTADDIIEIAHDEYIEDSVEKINSILFKMFETEEKIELHELVSVGMDKISTYIALLFLSTRTSIQLEQEEFYSDLYITQGA